MSSKPTVEGVAALRSLILRRRALSTEWHDLKKKTERMKEVENELGSIARDIDDVLRNMDCRSPGNAGWEARFLWLLDQLELQASKGVSET